MDKKTKKTLWEFWIKCIDEGIMEDIVSSDDKSDGTDHQNKVDPFFKPYLNAQERNDACKIKNNQECSGLRCKEINDGESILLKMACVVLFWKDTLMQTGSATLKTIHLPFEALYKRKCRTPIAWAEAGERKLIRPEIVQDTTDKIVQIKERLKTARDHQKSYADNRQKPLEFNVSDKVLLKV
ncbi:hypothetical protein Tco_0214147 [Tanacetum coccineum]